MHLHSPRPTTVSTALPGSVRAPITQRDRRLTGDFRTVGGQTAAQCMTACPFPSKGGSAGTGGVMPRPSTPSCAWNQHLRHGCVQAAKRLQWGKVMRRRDRPSPHPRRTSVSLGAPVTISDLQRLATAKASSVGSNGWLPFVRQQSASATLSLLRTVVLALNPAPAITPWQH